MKTTSKFFLLVVVLAAGAARADDKWDISKLDVSKLPPAADKKGLTYAKDLRPLFEASCFRCHGQERPKGGLQLDSLEAVLQGGEDGKVLVPGDSKKSPLLFAVARVDDEIAMPPKRRGGPGGGGGPGGFGGPGGPGGRGGFGLGLMLASQTKPTLTFSRSPALSIFLFDQAVTNPRLGNEKFRLSRVGFQLLSQVCQIDPQVMGLFDIGWAPHFAEDVPMGYHLAGVLNEQTQERVFSGRELDGLAFQGDGASGQIHFQIAGTKDGGVGRGKRATLGNSQAGQQFAGAERLGYVIVRAVIQRGDFILLPVADGEDDDRHAAPFAQALKETDTTHVRQSKVEEHHIRVVLRGFDQAFLPVGGFEHAVAAGFQTHAQQTPDLDFIVDHQDGGLDG